MQSLYLFLKQPYYGTSRDLLYLDKNISSRYRFLLFEVEEAILDELEGREEDGIYRARSGHRNAKTAIHMPLEEFNLRSWLHLLASGVHERIPLVYALRRVDRIWTTGQENRRSQMTS